MSYTEIYAFKKDGNAIFLGETKNSWRGAMSIWRIMEERYLTPLSKPYWMLQEDYDKNGYSRCGAVSFGKEPNPIKEIWDLFVEEKVSRVDKIVLGTTFDKIIVMRENVEETIKAFQAFEGETSLTEQSEIIKKIFEDDECIAIAWNQTSVCGDTWLNYGGYDEETEEEIPYNILTMEDHGDLFDDDTLKGADCIKIGDECYVKEYVKEGMGLPDGIKYTVKDIIKQDLEFKIVLGADELGKDWVQFFKEEELTKI